MPLARSKLRKVSKQPIRLLIKKRDRQLQDYYRSKYKGTPCESCGKPFELMHHFVEKSQSSFLRYHPDNLIFLCKSCHFRHHNTGDSAIMGNVILRRGKEWFNWIQENRRTPRVLNKTFLNSINAFEYVESISIRTLESAIAYLK